MRILIIVSILFFSLNCFAQIRLSSESNNTCEKVVDEYMNAKENRNREAMANLVRKYPSCFDEETQEVFGIVEKEEVIETTEDVSSEGECENAIGYVSRYGGKSGYEAKVADILKSYPQCFDDVTIYKFGAVEEEEVIEDTEDVSSEDVPLVDQYNGKVYKYVGSEEDVLSECERVVAWYNKAMKNRNRRDMANIVRKYPSCFDKETQKMFGIVENEEVIGNTDDVSSECERVVAGYNKAMKNRNRGDMASVVRKYPSCFDKETQEMFGIVENEDVSGNNEDVSSEVDGECEKAKGYVSTFGGKKGYKAKVVDVIESFPQCFDNDIKEKYIGETEKNVVTPPTKTNKVNRALRNKIKKECEKENSAQLRRLSKSGKKAEWRAILNDCINQKLSERAN